MLKGTNGKCIYIPKYNKWVTPVEFQHVCGSTQADFKEAIRLISGNNKQQLKQLFKNKSLTQHLSNCNCPSCLNNDYMQVDSKLY